MKPKKSFNPFIATTIIFFMTTIMFGLLVTALVIKNKNTSVSASSDNTATISNEDIEKFKTEEREDILSDMKLRLVNGDSSLSIFKSYFPDNIVYVNNKNQYVFADILSDVAKKQLMLKLITLTQLMHRITTKLLKKKQHTREEMQQWRWQYLSSRWFYPFWAEQR